MADNTFSLSMINFENILSVLSVRAYNNLPAVRVESHIWNQKLSKVVAFVVK